MASQAGEALFCVSGASEQSEGRKRKGVSEGESGEIGFFRANEVWEESTTSEV